jgi:translation initiation factor IF-3
VVFRGRELAHMEEGRKVIDQIVLDLADCSKMERPPAQEGKRIVCTLSPK